MSTYGYGLLKTAAELGLELTIKEEDSPISLIAYMV